MIGRLNSLFIAIYEEGSLRKIWKQLTFFITRGGFFQKVFIKCTNPCNKSWMVKGKSPYYIQTLYEIDKLLRLTS